jgi:hypothetical protein
MARARTLLESVEESAPFCLWGGAVTRRRGRRRSPGIERNGEITAQDGSFGVPLRERDGLPSVRVAPSFCPPLCRSSGQHRLQKGVESLARRGAGGGPSRPYPFESYNTQGWIEEEQRKTGWQGGNLGEGVLRREEGRGPEGENVSVPFAHLGADAGKLC